MASAGTIAQADPGHSYLLAPYEGEPIPGPDWFETAISAPAESGRIDVAGAGIDYRCWGARDRRGVLLVHGSNAHARWWDHVAPLLAADFRVAALSLSGMGTSDWRPHYSDTVYAEESLAVARAAGLFEAGAPYVVAHSFGGFALTALMAGVAESRLAGGVFLDSGVMLTSDYSGRPSSFPRRYYGSRREALARFRLMPPQPDFEPWIVDHIARLSLVEEAQGWTWAFDPDLWSRLSFDIGARPPQPNCPIAFMWGEQSALFTADRVASQRAWAPAGTPFVGIPGSGHHLMLDQPLALVAALRGLLLGWSPGR